MGRKMNMTTQQDRASGALSADELRERKKRVAVVKERRQRKKMLDEKPLMRGWFHLVTFPLSIAVTVVLICLAPAGAMTVAVSLFGATSMLLFGVSAALHIGHGHFPVSVDQTLCKIDYTNIFLIIAGTNTPFLFAIQNVAIRWTYLGIVWGLAILGTVLHLIWSEGLDWLFTIFYCILGLAPFSIIWLFFQSPYIGVVPTVLLICGGGVYIAGAVCFALRKPNPAPKVFGYHEIFHLATVLGYACHVVAIFMVVVKMRG